MTEPQNPPSKKRISLSTPSVCTLKIELQPQEIKPVIWRRIDVDGRISLAKLHHFIQAAFAWSDSHLHEFELRGRTFAIPDPDDQSFDRTVEDERKSYLNRLVAKGDVFLYRYDFGDNWEHTITVENISYDDDSDLKGGAYIIDGARACPPEDVGGFDGYHQFLETILVNPHLDEAKQMLDWAGGAFDPLHFDIRLANAAIFRMMYNRWGGK